MFGFLNVYKPVGMTSHDVVSILRRILKIKQIGHTGTLDPFAEGVLPICIGKATKLIEYLHEDKGYIAEIQFGKSTDTYDIEGKTTFESDFKVSKTQIQEIIKDFIGNIKQIPPIYSAKKVNGKKLYEYARNNEKIEIEPRDVRIDKIELLSFDYEKQTGKIEIECSRGTYIRSIANDIGNKLNCGAYLTKLIRTKSGKFTLNNAIHLSELNNPTIIASKLINPIEILQAKQYELNDSELNKVKNGQHFINKNIKNDDLLLLGYNNNIVAVATCSEYLIKVNKVFYNEK